jgi:hypothetical protein
MEEKAAGHLLQSNIEQQARQSHGRHEAQATPTPHPDNGNGNT